MTDPVYIVDEARDSRVSTSLSFRACGLESRPFVTGSDLLESLGELRPGVVMLRLRRSDSHNLGLLSDLRERRPVWPVVVLADHIMVAEAIAAMKLGAFDIVEMPVQVEVLLQALEAARQELIRQLGISDRLQRARASIDALSTRETEVLRALLVGYTNQGIAELYNISVRTVEMHRANLLKSLGAETLAGAVCLALEAGLRPLDRSAA